MAATAPICMCCAKEMSVFDDRTVFADSFTEEVFWGVTYKCPACNKEVGIVKGLMRGSTRPQSDNPRTMRYYPRDTKNRFRPGLDAKEGESR